MTDARTYPAGVTSWIDLQVDDLEAALAFYGGLFGWTFEVMSPPGLPFQYVVARLDGDEVAGLTGPAEPTGDPGRPWWRTYVAVDDIQATVAAVERAGGQVVGEPEEAGQAGHWVNCLDPQGAEFSLWQAGYRLGVQVANLPGAWNFSDLRSADPDASKPFYEAVFGWVFVDMGLATMIQVPGYGDHLAATVDPGIHERQESAPPGFADVIGGLVEAGDDAPGWQVSFTVADRDLTASLAESLGGHVVRREETDWTRTALIVDAQGASFTASQFTPPDAG